MAEPALPAVKGAPSVTSPPRTSGSGVACAPRLVLSALRGLPVIAPGDDLAVLIDAALAAEGLTLEGGDVLVVTSKIVSRAEGRFVDLATVTPSPRALDVAHTVRKDARLVELILRESASISRAAPDVLIVRHRLGFVGANAGIDCSNAEPTFESSGPPAGSGPWALLLPHAPDAAAEAIRAALEAKHRVPIGVVLSDSFGRPFRLGTVGLAIGCAGLPALWDHRGEPDIFGRKLEQTVTALADQVAAAADLVAGQAAEGRAVVHVRGLTFPSVASGAHELLRPEAHDLYAARGSR